MQFSLIIDPKKLPQDAVRVERSADDRTYLVEHDGTRTLFVGVPEHKSMPHRTLQLFLRKVVASAKAQKCRSIAIAARDLVFKGAKYNDAEIAEACAIGALMGAFSFNKYLTPPKDGWKDIETFYLIADKKHGARALTEGLRRGAIIGAEVNATRALANTPGGAMTPTLLAQEAERSVKGLPIRVTILDEKEMRKLGMGCVLGVAQGSSEKPRFIIMEYLKGKKGDKPLVLVGKGVTFDTGGLNLKPTNGIGDMHMDMSGGAAVIHAIAAAAKLGLKKNIVGLVPAVENMPSGSSYRPGDILHSLSGKSVEVGNTDAEGRLILADALTYAERFDPRLVIDVATLTGAAEAALGVHASALFTKDHKIEGRLRELGEKTGDYLWPLPLWDEYLSEVKGTFGDLMNIGKIRWGDAIHGAIFLAQFTEKYPWVHLDIAPKMVANDQEFLSKGATGVPVRLLVRFAEEF